MCTKLHIFNRKKIPLSWKILHSRRWQRWRLISAVENADDDDDVDDDLDDDDDTYQLVRISWCHYWRVQLETNHLTEATIDGGTLTCK